MIQGLIGASLWQSLLNGLGFLLSTFFDVVGNYGIAIIMLTIVTKLALMPLTIKQTRSMAAMARIQPQLKEIQKKHKGDRQRLNEEMMKLYKEHKVNPLGGCLPILLQLPFFFALFQVLRNGTPPGTMHLPAGSALRDSIAGQSSHFLGMNLSCTPTQGLQGAAEAVNLSCGSGMVNAIPFFFMVALMVYTTYFQSKQMQPPGGAGQQQQMMARIMPIFLGFISISMPAGLLVYWVTSNAWQIGQQHIMLKKGIIQRPVARELPERGKAGGGPGIMGLFRRPDAGASSDEGAGNKGGKKSQGPGSSPGKPASNPKPAGNSRSGNGRKGSAKGLAAGNGATGDKAKPVTDKPKTTSSPGVKSSARNRKKRRKR